MRDFLGNAASAFSEAGWLTRERLLLAGAMSAIVEAAEQYTGTQVVALVDGQLSWGDFISRVKYETAAMRVQPAGEVGRIQAADAAQQQATFDNLFELSQMMQARTDSLNQAIRHQAASSLYPARRIAAGPLSFRRTCHFIASTEFRL
jgi:hypothetical protein